jgi:hypothetical protein
MVVVVGILQASPVCAADKKMTTNQHQNSVMKRVNDAQKAKQLTPKQAKKFRHDLSKIAVKKQKLADKKLAGKTERGDASKVDKSLANTSEQITEVKQQNVEDARQSSD